jgi:hypothetical protein
MKKKQRIGSFATRTLQAAAAFNRLIKTDKYKLMQKFGFPASPSYQARWTIEETTKDSRGWDYHRMADGSIRRA